MYKIKYINTLYLQVNTRNKHKHMCIRKKDFQATKVYFSCNLNKKIGQNNKMNYKLKRNSKYIALFRMKLKNYNQN